MLECEISIEEIAFSDESERISTKLFFFLEICRTTFIYENHESFLMLQLSEERILVRHLISFHKQYRNQYIEPNRSNPFDEPKIKMKIKT